MTNTKKKTKSPRQEAALLLNDKQEQEAFKSLVKQSMPEFVAELENKEDVGNAMFEAGQELMLVVEDVLIRYFKFNDTQLKTFHVEVGNILTGVKEFEKHGLEINTPHSVGVVGDKIQEDGIGNLMKELAEIRMTKGKMGRAGLEMPTLPEASVFLKQLNKKNKN